MFQLELCVSVSFLHFQCKNILCNKIRLTFGINVIQNVFCLEISIFGPGKQNVTSAIRKLFK